MYGPLLRRERRPLVVDLGYGASPITTAELFARLRSVHPQVEVVGIEIDPERVAAARPYEREGLSFRLGGFELPVDRAPTLIRAFNVLRQYAEADAWQAWDRLCGGLAPGGVLVEGTCGEIGRRAVWVALERGRSGTGRQARVRAVPARSRSPRTSRRCRARPSWPNASRRRSFTATCRASACTSCWRRSTVRGQRPPRSRCSGRGSAGSPPSNCSRATIPSTPARRSADVTAGGSARSPSPGPRPVPHRRLTARQCRRVDRRVRSARARHAVHPPPGGRPPLTAVCDCPLPARPRPRSVWTIQDFRPWKRAGVRTTVEIPNSGTSRGDDCHARRPREAHAREP